MNNPAKIASASASSSSLLRLSIQVLILYDPIRDLCVFVHSKAWIWSLFGLLATIILNAVSGASHVVSCVFLGPIKQNQTRHIGI